jgi:hypothetical protein
MSVRLAIFGFICLFVISGCAVQSSKNKITFTPDLAQVFGMTMDEKTLPGGDTITLRRMGDEWSMKFGYISRMISLGKLNSGRIMHVGVVERNVNILLETSTASCQRAYVLVSLGDRLSADKWDIKRNCQDALARITFGKGEEYFDFVNEKTVTRYTYRNGSLLRSNPITLPAPKPAKKQPAPTPPVAAQRPQDKAQAPRPESTQTAKTTPASLPPQPPSPPASPSTPQVAKPDDKVVLPDNIDFGKPVEQKKTTIDLS